jgi:hypothetical protein
MFECGSDFLAMPTLFPNVYLRRCVGGYSKAMVYSTTTTKGRE